MADWQTIETAPEVANPLAERPTPALLYSPRFGVRSGGVCRWRGVTYGSVPTLHGDAVSDWGATHWMPMPEPPAALSSDGGV